jgi:selenide,water dikinase
MARGAGLQAVIDWRKVPMLPGVRELAARGFVTGASGRNWAAHIPQVALPRDFGAVELALLNDPQTSGGLLVACSSDAVDAVMAVFRDQGFAQAAVVGEMVEPGDAAAAKLVVR